MNELSYLEDIHSPRYCSQSVASPLRSVLSSFSELVLGILGVLVHSRDSRPFARSVVGAVLLLLVVSCGEARPLILPENIIIRPSSASSSTLPPVKARSLQSIIDEIMSTANQSALVMHHDIYRRSLERWSNPCELPGFIFDEAYLEDVPHADPMETARRILQATKSARGPAEKLLHDYGVRIFRDPHYINYAIMKLNWLPAADPKTAQHMSLRRAIKYFSDKLPFYGIALTQVTLDQVLYSGPFIEETREVEIILTQDVCQLQLGGLSLGVRPSRTEISDAMSKDYRDMKSKSQRDLRDILILRDYNDFLQVMEETFQGIVERTLQNTSSSVATEDVFNTSIR